MLIYNEGKLGADWKIEICTIQQDMLIGEIEHRTMKSMGLK